MYAALSNGKIVQISKIVILADTHMHIIAIELQHSIYNKRFPYQTPSHLHSHLDLSASHRHLRF